MSGRAREGLRAHIGLGLLVGLATLAGCAAQPGDDGPRQMRIGDNINIYDMFDNSRPWGSSYLVGPPDHHDGYGARIDDLRTPPPRYGGADGAAADPRNPPASGVAPPTLTDKPLPALP